MSITGMLLNHERISTTKSRRSLTLVEAETLTLRTLKQVMEEKLDAKNVQLASVTKSVSFETVEVSS